MESQQNHKYCYKTKLTSSYLHPRHNLAMTTEKRVFHNKKKTKKSLVPKKLLLGHKAVKSLLKLAKTIRTNIIRKYLRKIKSENEEDDASKENKLLGRISEFKVRYYFLICM
jgi:hypothetical protein